MEDVGAWGLNDGIVSGVEGVSFPGVVVSLWMSREDRLGRVGVTDLHIGHVSLVSVKCVGASGVSAVLTRKVSRGEKGVDMLGAG
jgi:hypothetical protein